MQKAQLTMTSISLVGKEGVCYLRVLRWCIVLHAPELLTCFLFHKLQMHASFYPPLHGEIGCLFLKRYFNQTEITGLTTGGNQFRPVACIMQAFWVHLEPPMDSWRGSLFPSPAVASVELQLRNEGGKTALAMLSALTPPR